MILSRTEYKRLIKFHPKKMDNLSFEISYLTYHWNLKDWEKFRSENDYWELRNMSGNSNYFKKLKLGWIKEYNKKNFNINL